MLPIIIAIFNITVITFNIVMGLRAEIVFLKYFSFISAFVLVLNLYYAFITFIQKVDTPAFELLRLHIERRILEEKKRIAQLKN